VCEISIEYSQENYIEQVLPKQDREEKTTSICARESIEYGCIAYQSIGNSSLESLAKTNEEEEETENNQEKREEDQFDHK
jgi:hypothetical protein